MSKQRNRTTSSQRLSFQERVEALKVISDVAPRPAPPAGGRDDRLFSSLAFGALAGGLALGVMMLRRASFADALYYSACVAFISGCAIGLARFFVTDFSWQRDLFTRYEMRRLQLIEEIILNPEESREYLDDDPWRETPAQQPGVTIGELDGAAWAILYRHFRLGKGTSREECYEELGIKQSLWNVVNEELQHAGLKTTGRSWAPHVTTMEQAWRRWISHQYSHRATLEMASRPLLTERGQRR